VRLTTSLARLTASLEEQRATRLKHDTFIWISPEDLQHFKLRWDKLTKELTRVGIDIVMLPPEKNRFLQFVSALKTYGHSTVVQMSCIVRASEVDTNPDYNIAKFYGTLISLSISQHPVVTTGVPQIKDATALQARTIRQHLKGSKKGARKKGKGGKESASSSQPAKESSESKPHTKALVDKKAKETGESAADIRTLGIKPAPPGHLFVPWGSPFYAPGSPFHAPGLLSCDPGASFCALGSTFCTPTKLNLYHISTTNFFLNAQR
jgi:hypothetical protein